MGRLSRFDVSVGQFLQQEKKLKNVKGEQQQKEEQFMNQQLQAQHAVDSLETKCQQFEKNLSASHSAKYFLFACFDREYHDGVSLLARHYNRLLKIRTGSWRIGS